MNNYSIKEFAYMGRVGPRVGSGRVGSDFLSAIAGRVGSIFRRVGSGRVQEKWPVDNSGRPLYIQICI